MILISVILLLISQIMCKNCVMDDGTRDPNREWILQEDLLKNDLRRPPNNATTVVMKFILKSFTFDDQETIFSIYSWVFFSWKDDRYKWNPEEYEDLTETQFEGHNIWIPQLKPFNKFGYGDSVMKPRMESFMNASDIKYRYKPSVECLATHTGHVTCLGRLLAATVCNNNLTRWPFDTQTCTFEYGAYNKYKYPVNFTFNSTRGVSMLAAEYGPGWNIMDFEKGENSSSETVFYLKFVVERQGVGLAAVTIVPSFVLAVLTITSLFLNDNTRLTIILLSLVGHFFFLKEINELIPKHGSTTPTILHFVSGSVIFTTIFFVSGFLLNFLRKITVKPIRFVIIIHDFIKKSPIKLIILNHKNSHCVDNENTKVWSYLANVINTITIIVAIIVYVSTFIAYIPRELPIDYEYL